MDALRIERDDDVLRIVLARPRDAERLRRRRDRGAGRGVRRRRQGSGGRPRRRGSELLRGCGHRMDAAVGLAHPRRERCRRQRAAPHVRRDRHLPGAGDRRRPGPCARRRGRPRGHGRHRRRPRAGGVRVLGGQARHHPGRDLALRAPQDRRERGPPLLRHRRALRCRDGSPDRPRARGRRPISMPHWRRSSASSARAGPRAARHAKRLVLDRPDGPETARRIAERRASDEGQAGLAAFIERRRPPWAPPLEPDA